METYFFTEFGLILVLACAMALVMKLLRQPLIIGHILTGLLVGPLAFNLLQSQEVFKLFSEMGIAFLLFSVGLSLNPRVLKDYGRTALITGLGQVIFTTLVGLAVTTALGFSFIPALYISVALAFSSTIVILKLISDKGDLDTLYGKIAIGFLLVQDLVAIILLFSLPLLSAGSDSWMDLILVFGLAFVVTALVFLVARVLVKKLHPYLSSSSEMLFLFSIAWGIGIAALFKEVGFSLETGALIAGIALASLPSRNEINSRLSTLRDFFIIVFFVVLGAQMAFGSLQAMIVPALILSLLVLVGNPLILMIIMGVLGYRRKTSLQTGFTVAQISEFSLILVALGVSLGQVSSEELAMVTLVGLVTIFGSTYLILYSDWWYKILGKYLKIFERKKIVERAYKAKKYKFVLFGGNRIGFDFIEMFEKRNKPFLVVDNDPEVIHRLGEHEIDCEYGDAGDVDFLESLHLEKAKLVVSTIPDLNTNLLIIEKSRRDEEASMVMVVAHSIANAMILYDAGASYVVLPHFLGGKHATNIAGKLLGEFKEMHSIRVDHMKYLNKRIDYGHEHPVLERYR